MVCCQELKLLIYYKLIRALFSHYIFHYYKWNYLNNCKLQCNYPNKNPYNQNLRVPFPILGNHPCLGLNVLPHPIDVSFYFIPFMFGCWQTNCLR